MEVYDHDNRGKADGLPKLTLLIILENYSKFIPSDISKTELNLFLNYLPIEIE